MKTRGHFPSDEAATKLLWLALRNITGKWGSSTHDFLFDAFRPFTAPHVDVRLGHP